MSTRAEELKVLEQRTNAARKRALLPVKSVKPVTRVKGTGPVKAAPRRTVKRRAVIATHARVG